MGISKGMSFQLRGLQLNFPTLSGIHTYYICLISFLFVSSLELRQVKNLNVRILSWLIKIHSPCPLYLEYQRYLYRCRTYQWYHNFSLLNVNGIFCSCIYLTEIFYGQYEVR